MPETQSFNQLIQDLQPEKYPWLWQVFGIVFAILLASMLTRMVLNRWVAKAKVTNTLWDDAVLAALRKPVIWMIWLYGFYVVMQLIESTTESELFALLEQVREVLVIVVLTLFLAGIVKQIEWRFLADDEPRDGDGVDQTTVMALGKLTRIAIFITGALVVLQNMGYSISGVLAFGGIGGIAVGFAAKDLLANFFGGLMIYLDRPFEVGNWIRSPDRSIEGTVEDIGWRQTRIRTFDKRPLYVPNSVFANVAVENPSRMLNRRIYETIGLRYEDQNAIPAILDDIREMLRGHEDIDQNQTLIVNFNTFGGHSLDFFVYAFTKTTDWVRFHEVKQDVLLRILEIVHNHGGDVAYPTERLHVDTIRWPDQPAAAQGPSAAQAGT